MGYLWHEFGDQPRLLLADRRIRHAESRAGPGRCGVGGDHPGGAMAETDWRADRVRCLTACGGGGAAVPARTRRELRCAPSPRPTSPATVGLSLRPGSKPPMLAAAAKTHTGRWSEVVRDIFRPGRGLGTGHYRPVSDLRDKRAELPRLRGATIQSLTAMRARGDTIRRRPDSGRVGGRHAGISAGEGRTTACELVIREQASVAASAGSAAPSTDSQKQKSGLRAGLSRLDGWPGGRWSSRRSANAAA